MLLVKELLNIAVNERVLLVKELLNIVVNDFDAKKLARYRTLHAHCNRIHLQWDPVLTITMSHSQNQLEDTQWRLLIVGPKILLSCNRMLGLTEPKLDPMYMIM